MLRESDTIKQNNNVVRCRVTKTSHIDNSICTPIQIEAKRKTGHSGKYLRNVASTAFQYFISRHN